MGENKKLIAQIKQAAEEQRAVERIGKKVMEKVGLECQKQSSSTR